MTPTLLHSALQTTADVAQSGEFRFSPVIGLPKSRVGAYLSRQTLSQTDMDLLSNAMVKSARDGNLRVVFEKYYPIEVVTADIVNN